MAAARPDVQFLTQEMAKGNPSIRIGRVSGTGDKGILISVLTLQADEEKIIASRLVELLKTTATCL